MKVIIDNNNIKLKVVFYLLYVLIFTILFLLYKTFICSTYAYVGYPDNLQIDKFIISIILFLFILIFMPSEFRKPSDLLLNLHFIFPVIPMLIIYSFIEGSYYSYILSVFLSFTIIIFLRNITLIPFIKFANVRKDKILYILFAVFILLLLLAAIRNYSYFNIDITKVYDYRHEVSENIKGIYSYLLMGIFPVIGYFLIGLSLERKRYLFFIFITFCFFLFFAFVSHRQYLFTPFLLLVIFFSLKLRKAVISLLLFILLIIILAVVVDELWLDVWAKAIVLDRLMFLPALINFYYYDFFSKNPFTLFTDSPWFRFIIDYQYDMPIPNLIGYEYFGSSLMAANTGWIGSGFQQAGFLGLFIYATIIGLMFRYVDYKAKSLGKTFVTTTFAPFIPVVFLSADLKTGFLSNGLLYYLLLLSLISEKK